MKEFLKRPSVAERYKIVEAWRKSGLTQSEYARRHDLNPKALSCWAIRLKKEEEEKRNGGNFIPIVLEGLQTKFKAEGLSSGDLSDKPHKIYVRHVNGWQVELPYHVDVNWLSNLLRSLI